MGSGDLGLSATKTKPDVAGKKRKKPVKTRLPQELVDEITKRPLMPLPAIPDDLLAGFSDKCRAAFVAQRADMEKLAALDADIIRQYEDNGYVEVEKEVAVDDNDEEKTEDDDCPMRKRKKLVKTRLPENLVDEIMKKPVMPFPAIPDELLVGFSDECRAAFMAQRAEIEELAALDADIIRQYKDNGYAEVEVEVATDDNNED